MYSKRARKSSVKPGRPKMAKKAEKAGDRIEENHSGLVLSRAQLPLMCHCRRISQGEYHIAKLIQRRIVPSSSPQITEYYVHYTELDKRHDDWVCEEWIDLSRKVETPKVVARAHEDETKTRLTRNKKKDLDIAVGDKKRKLEDERNSKIKFITMIQYGPWTMKTWYHSPYPEDFGKQKKLFICHSCLCYFREPHNFIEHCRNCPETHPPGKRVYKHGKLAVYEIDGRHHKSYCQNLCLLAKLYIDHKTLYYDVEPFRFYVLVEFYEQAGGGDGGGCVTVGYFSKERESTENNNLACILVLPPFQKKSYGKFLIQFSYELSKLEGKPGSPEKPLSDLGRLGYLSYWKYAVLLCLKSVKGRLTFETMSRQTGITRCDILDTFQALGIVKYWLKDAIWVEDTLIECLLKSQHFKVPRLPVHVESITLQGEVVK